MYTFCRFSQHDLSISGTFDHQVAVHIYHFRLIPSMCYAVSNKAFESRNPTSNLQQMSLQCEMYLQ